MYFLIENGGFSNVMLREAARFQQFRKFLPANKWRLLVELKCQVYLPPKKKRRWRAGTSTILSRCNYFLLEKRDFFPIPYHPCHNLPPFGWFEFGALFGSFSRDNLPTFGSMVYLTWKPIKKKNQTNEGKYTNPMDPMVWGYRMSCRISCNFKWLVA